MTAFLSAAKAEVLMGVLLVVRHRTPRLAGVLVLAIVASKLMAHSTDGAGGGAVWINLVAGGSLAAVATSRLLAPGANLAAGYHAASWWWLVPAARLVGGLAVTVPVLTAATLLLGATSLTVPEVVRLGMVTACYAASCGALVLAVTPVMGGSGAAAAGFILAWFGTVPPSGVATLVERWPPVEGPLVLMWNTLPLGWRAARWFEHGDLSDPILFLFWLPVGIAAAAWTMTVCYRSQHPRPGSDP
ncbi:MAG: hypothetical protein JSW71_02050 [Gemmatimonadota bacterium]|nr:MAG: hypothetical protein JSW71_02050 [Gemmatimonadota bacterium]